MRHKYQYPDPSVALSVIKQKFDIDGNWTFVDREGLYKLDLFCRYSGKFKQYMNPAGLEKAQKFFEELGCQIITKEDSTKHCFITMTSDTFEYLLKYKLETVQNDSKECGLEEMER